MPPKRRFYEPEDFKVVEPPTHDKAQADALHLVDDHELLSINMNWAYYEAQYHDLTLKLEAAYAEFQKIIEDFTGGKIRGSKQDKLSYFDERINKAKQYVALVQQKERDLWFFLNENPLKISGALFNAELAKKLVDLREELLEIFSDKNVAPLQKKFNKLITKEIPKLTEACENLVRPQGKPTLNMSGALFRNPERTARNIDDELKSDEMDD